METILIQESDQSVRDVLTIALENEGFLIRSCAECDILLVDMVDRIRPQLVILDFKINGEQAISMCRELKWAYYNLPVLAMSCNTEIKILSRQFGFDDYIKKPFDLERLFKIIRRNLPVQSY